jgi:hypothetical protein
MDFDRFIEKDILNFLDKRTVEIASQAAHLREEEFSLFEISSDYSKDLNEALKDGNISRARQILEEVKIKYVQAPEGSASKKRLYSVIEEMYERIRDFEEGNTHSSLLDTIKGYEKKVLLSNQNAFSNKKDEELALVVSTISLKEKEIEEILSKDDLSSMDIEKAAKDYKELKDLVSKIPADKVELKSKMSEKAVGLYKEIRKAINNKTKEEMPDKDPMQEARLLDERLEEVRMIKENIVTAHTSISQALRKKDLTTAVKEYRKLKNLCESFPRELPEEKTALLAEAVSLYEKISGLKAYLQRKSRHQEDKRHIDQASVEESPKPLAPEQQISHLKFVHPTGDAIHDLLNEVDVSHRKIEEHLMQEDIKGAVAEYAHLKLLCSKYPKENDPEEKVSLLAGALAAFESIRRTKETIARRKKEEHEKRLQEEEDAARFSQLRSELLEKISKVKELLAQKDSQGAIKAYADLKEFFNNYPDDELEQKKQLYEEILSAHFDMSLLDKDFKNKSPISSVDKITEIKAGIKRAESFISKSRLEDAGHEILEVKHKIALLPREEFDEKYTLLKETEELEHKLIVEKNLESAEDKKASMQAMRPVQV